MKWVERLAIWFLQRRGRVTLPDRLFVLAVSGNAMAAYDSATDTWRVSFPAPPKHVYTVALKGSQVLRDWEAEGRWYAERAG